YRVLCASPTRRSSDLGAQSLLPDVAENIVPTGLKPQITSLCDIVSLLSAAQQARLLRCAQQCHDVTQRSDLRLEASRDDVLRHVRQEALCPEIGRASCRGGT